MLNVENVGEKNNLAIFPGTLMAYKDDKGFNVIRIGKGKFPVYWVDQIVYWVKTQVF